MNTGVLDVRKEFFHIPLSEIFIHNIGFILNIDSSTSMVERVFFLDEKY
jgi:hypothetical protein